MMTDTPVPADEIATLTQRVADLEAVIAQLMADPRVGRRVLRDAQGNAQVSRIVQRAGETPPG
jgi:hypothetical protein